MVEAALLSLEQQQHCDVYIETAGSVLLLALLDWYHCPGVVVAGLVFSAALLDWCCWPGIAVAGPGIVVTGLVLLAALLSWWHCSGVVFLASCPQQCCWIGVAGLALSLLVLYCWQYCWVDIAALALYAHVQPHCCWPCAIADVAGLSSCWQCHWVLADAPVLSMSTVMAKDLLIWSHNTLPTPLVHSAGYFVNEVRGFGRESECECKKRECLHFNGLSTKSAHCEKLS